MKRLVQTVAIGAALVAVALGVWRDCGALLTLQRATLAYLLAYFLAGIMYLGGQAALAGARDPEPPPPPEEDNARGKRKRRPPAEATGSESTANQTAASPSGQVQETAGVETR
jgi:hypothetical protein